MRGSGLMVSAEDLGSSIPGSSPGQVFFTLTVPLSHQMYKWSLHATEIRVVSHVGLPYQQRIIWMDASAICRLLL